jgi:diguanylate cyclase (GGDEF)-like protein/PAS domain S-box-containing protein
VDVLKISELYISLFDDNNENFMTAQNMVAVRKSQLITIENKAFPSKNILPNGVEAYKNRYTLMVFPLSFRKKHLGFMTINLSDRKGDAFENLRAIISSALKNEILIQDLQLAEKRFSDIAHSTSNWLWETNMSHEFTYCSASSLDIIGYSPEVLLDKKINAFNIDKDDSCINRMFNHEDLTEYESWYKHRNGKVICLLISAKAIFMNGSFDGYRGIFEDITEQKLQQDKINNLAYSDILTGLPNRTLFQEQLAETISYSSLNNKKFALMFIDLDHFKHVNDSMGHATGDQLLVKIAERLSFSIRSHDMLARLGGDEFVVILPEIDNDAEVIEVAERIFSHIQEPVMLNDKTIYIGLSLGISLYPNDGVEPELLLKKGDNAMYQAKSQGRNNYVFYDKLLDQKYALRNLNEEILREALITKGFILNYQPQVSAETGTIIGFEALVRIKNSANGIVLPDNFISLAEELGFIDQIDTWVFEKACAQHKAWQNMGLANTRLSINLSALQLQNISVLDTYISIIKYYKINPTEIQIEITENALIRNEQVVLEILRGFKRHGVRIALDDFGTGYSSLNCINLYPIDTIKIDQSFVKDVADNPKNKALIEGIILIASNLNLNIIAEGVETKAQYEYMKNLGCHEIQGYFFYKPCSTEHAQVLLENNKKR